MATAILNELNKTKRSFILLILAIPPFLVVFSGVASISQYLTPAYTNAWTAMFIQSALLFSYYLMPFSLVLVCVMVVQREKTGNGLMKMLALPQSVWRMAFAKCLIVLFFNIIEIIFFFVFFALMGVIASSQAGIMEAFPFVYILKWSGIFLLASIPMTAVSWMICILVSKPLLAAGINMLLIAIDILVANLPAYFLFPYCYAGKLITAEMVQLRGEPLASFETSAERIFVMGLIITVLAIVIACWRYGKRERK